MKTKENSKTYKQIKKLLSFFQNSRTASLQIYNSEISCGILEINGVEHFFRGSSKELTTQQMIFLFYYYILLNTKLEDYLRSNLKDTWEYRDMIDDILANYDVDEDFNNVPFIMISVTERGLPKGVMDWFLKNCVSHTGFRRNPNSGNNIIVFTLSLDDYMETHFKKVEKTFK